MGGLSEEENDVLEREAAMSSPLKGIDHRGSAKVILISQRHKSFLLFHYLGHDKGNEREC